MGGQPRTVVAADADALAAGSAQRLATSLCAVLDERPVAHLVLTGGGILERLMRSTAALPGFGGVDWRRVHVWWGDERYVAADSDERNDVAAFAALLGEVAFDPARIHRMPAADGPFGDDVDAAADAYAAELAEVAAGAGGAPHFDLALLGVGPDGHCASLFPRHPAVYEQRRTVVGVHDSPKPPPTRLTLTFAALAAAEEIWFVASGQSKADAVARAHNCTDRTQVPAAGPRGRRATVWLVDRPAASGLTRPDGP